MSRITDFFGRVSSWFDGYKTHLANVFTIAVQAVAWKKHWSIEASAVSLAITTALTSLARMFAKKPGPLA